MSTYSPEAYTPILQGKLQKGDQCGVHHEGRPFEFLGGIDPSNIGRDVSTFSKVWRFLRPKPHE